MNVQHDPLQNLQRLSVPEPDPVTMNSTIAQSREAFVSSFSRGQAPRSESFGDWFRRSTRWLMPTTVGVGALAIAMIVVVQTDMVSTFGPNSADRDIVADIPDIPAPPPAPSTSLSRGGDTTSEASPDNTGIRLGIQPNPGQPVGEPLPEQSFIFAGEGIRIGARLSAMAFDISLPDISGETVIDSQPMLPGEQIELLSAFRLEEQQIVAVQFRVDDTRFWRIYRPVEGQYTRDQETSLLVSDANDRAEVEQRLSAL